VVLEKSVGELRSFLNSIIFALLGRNYNRSALLIRFSFAAIICTTLILPFGVSGQSGNSSTTPSDIVLLNQQYRSTGADYDLLHGAVKNIGNKTAKSITILMNTFDKDGVLIRADAINETLGTLDPGQKLDFNLTAAKDNFVGMYDYSLSLQWLDESSQLQIAEEVTTYPEQ
jgi:hypothetical protein